jgi:hypothetical protein
MTTVSQLPEEPADMKHPKSQSDVPPVLLTQEERDAVTRSKAAAARGDFATDDEVRAVWAKHGR